MKAIIALLACATSVASAFAQGTVVFDNNLPGVVVSHVYGPDPTGTVHHGNGPTDFPPGNEDWSRLYLLAGTGWSAQLFAAPGANVPAGSLAAVSPITHFKTGDEAGFVIPMIATLAGIPEDSPVATLQLRVWDNHGGSAATWNDALFADPVTIGQSRPINVYNIGGSVNPPPALSGLVSFSTVSYVLVPEPSAVSLFGFGLAALILHGHRRQR